MNLRDALRRIDQELKRRYPAMMIGPVHPEREYIESMPDGSGALLEPMRQQSEGLPESTEESS